VAGTYIQPAAAEDVQQVAAVAKISRHCLCCASCGPMDPLLMLPMAGTATDKQPAAAGADIQAIYNPAGC
jgi:hypothetical protein